MDCTGSIGINSQEVLSRLNKLLSNQIIQMSNFAFLVCYRSAVKCENDVNKNLNKNGESDG